MMDSIRLGSPFKRMGKDSHRDISVDWVPANRDNGEEIRISEVPELGPGLELDLYEARLLHFLLGNALKLACGGKFSIEIETGFPRRPSSVPCETCGVSITMQPNEPERTD